MADVRVHWKEGEYCLYTGVEIEETEKGVILRRKDWEVLIPVESVLCIEIFNKKEVR